MTKPKKYGLVLSPEDAALLVQGRKEALIEQQRIEFGTGIITRIILEFCDSQFINQNNYVETMLKLQEIFYLYKNEMEDEISDDELIHLMKEQFEQLCFGDLDYLETTCLYNFAEAVRAGYSAFHRDDARSEASNFDIIERWSYDLYYARLQELFWQ